MSKQELPEVATSVKITDVVPLRTEFKIGDKVYAFKPFTLRDMAWAQEKFGKGLEEILVEMNYKTIAQIMFHQLQDKTDFLGSEEEIINDDGFKETIKITGADKLADAIGPQADVLDIFRALLKSCGISEEIIDKYFSNKKEDVKKNEEAKSKKEEA